MFVEDLFDFTVFLKNQGQSRWFPPEEVIAALNRAQIDKYNQEFKKFESNGEVTDSMQPFKKNKIIIRDNDQFILPDDYYNHTNIASIVKEESVIVGEYPAADIVSDDEWLEWKRIDSLLTPSTEYPVFRLAGGYIDYLPITLNFVKLYYLRSIVKAVYNYNIVDGGIVFNSALSVDPIFSEKDHNILVVQTLKYLGVQLRDNMATAFDQIHTLKTDS